MEEQDKDIIKLKLATCFRLILRKKKGIALKNKREQIEDIRLIDSMRQLEAESGLSYTIIQNVFAAKRDIQFTTLITLIENLGLSFTEFAQLYDALSENELTSAREYIQQHKSGKRK